MTNINEKLNIPTREVTSEVLAKLKKKARFFIDNYRWLGGNAAFEKMIYSHKPIKSHGQIVDYEKWGYSINPCIKNVVITENQTEEQAEQTNEGIFLFGTQWRYKLSFNELYIDNNGKPPEGETKPEFDARIRAELKEIKKHHGGVIQVDNYCLNFKDAFFLGGAPDDKKLVFTKCPDNYQAILDWIGIEVVENEMIREIESYYHDKKNNLRYQILTGQIANIILSSECFTGSFKGLRGEYEAAKDVVAGLNKFHPVRRYIHSLKDKYGYTESTALIDLIFDCLGLETRGSKEIEACYRHIFRSFLVSAIAAVTTQPFSSRLIPVFVGEQGCGKSSIGQKLFGGIAARAYTTITKFDIENKDHQKIMHNAWAVELADCPWNLSKKNKISSMKSATESTYPYRPLYSNEIIHLLRQAIWFMTLNEVSIRDSESTRFPVLNIKEKVNLNKIDELLGLKLVGEKETIVEDYDKYNTFWNQVRCLHESGHGWSLRDEHKKILHRIATVTERKSLLTLKIIERFGIDEESWNYKEFLKGIDTYDIQKNEYDGYNESMIAEKLVKFDDPECKDTLKLNRNTKEIHECMSKLFGKKSSVRLRDSGRVIWGWKCPLFKNNDQLKAFHEKQLQIEKAKQEVERELKKREAEKPVFSLVQ